MIKIRRSSQQRCSVRKTVLRNLEKLGGKHLCQSLFFDKKRGLQLIKKETLAQVFSCEFCEISKNIFFIEHVWATAFEFGLLRKSSSFSFLTSFACVNTSYNISIFTCSINMDTFGTAKPIFFFHIYHLYQKSAAFYAGL